MAQTVLNETQIPDVVTDSTMYGTGKTGDPLGVSGTSSQFNFVTGSIAFADTDGQLIEDNLHLRYNSTLRSIRMGKDYPFINFADGAPIATTAESAGTSIEYTNYVYGTGTSGFPYAGYSSMRSRGTVEVPLPVQKDDILGTFFSYGYNGNTFQVGTRVRSYADQNWVTGSAYGSRLGFWVVPSGTTAIAEKMTLYGDSLNLINTGTYNVNGTPHTHTASNITDIAYGTWTPTGTAGTNVSAVTPGVMNYIRIGNQVMFNGSLQVDVTAVGAFTCYLTLPIASNFSASTDASGNGTQPGVGIPNIISIREDSTNDRLQLDGYNQVDTNTFYRLSGGYIIK